MAILLVSIVVFFPGLSGPFIYDDNTHIANNPKIHSPTSVEDVVFNGKRQRRVLFNLSLGLNGMISGDSPFGYKVFNLLLHLLNIALVFLLMVRIEKRWSVAVVTTALFAFHPLQVEGVTYIFGRISTLSATWVFVSLYLLARTRDYPLMQLVPVYFLALVTKESAVLLLGIWPLFEVLVKRRPVGFLVSRPALLTYSLALFYIPLHLLLTGASNFWSRSVGFDLYPYSDHVLNQLFYYFYMPVLMLAPQFQSIYHPLRYQDPQLYLGAFFGLTLIGLAIWHCRRSWSEKPIHSFFILFFFFNLVVTNGPLQMINPFAEYRLYISNLSLFYFLALLLYHLISKLHINSRVFTMSTCTLLGVFALLTFQSTKMWGNGYEVYQHSASLYPDYEKNLTFAGVGCELEGKLECAEDYYSKAIELIFKSGNPSAKPLFRLSSIQMKMNKFDNALTTLEKIPVEKLAKVPAQFYQRKLYLLAQLKRQKQFEETLETASKLYPAGTFKNQIQFANEVFAN